MYLKTKLGAGGGGRERAEEADGQGDRLLEHVVISVHTQQLSHVLTLNNTEISNIIRHK